MDSEIIPFVPPPPVSGIETEERARYLLVRLSPEGKIEVQGSRQAVEDFFRRCAEEGLLISLDYMSWCG